MNEIILTAKAELDHMAEASTGNHIRTGDIRRLSARLFKGVKGESQAHVFSVCTQLLEQRNWPMGVIAFDFAYRVRSQYDGATFLVFESWLENYVRGWGDCDDFCTHAFGALICRYTELAERIVCWTKRDEFWMRRASAVVLIPSIRHDSYKETKPLQIADALMTDAHDLVRKGYGWMLKILSTKEPGLVYEYLLENKAVMPGVSFRYAMQKMDAAKKELLLH